MPVGAPFLVAHLLGCSILWASGFLLIKLVPDMPPVALAACRGLIAAATLSAWFLLRRETILPRGREWRDWAVLGTLNGWGPNILVAAALMEIGAGLAAMIQAAGPLAVALMAHFLFADERLDARRAGGLLVGFVGVGVLIGPAALPSGAASLTGAVLMLAVTLLYALGNVYVRFVPEGDAARLALGQQMVSGPAALALALLFGGPDAFGAAPAHGLALLALGVVATAMPIVLFMRLIRRAGPTRAATVGYLLPVWTALLAFAVLGETVSGRDLLGGAIVLGGVAFVSAPRSKRASVGSPTKAGSDLPPRRGG
jgi:drug/metabolite transporter (DMT)-like permease